MQEPLRGSGRRNGIQIEHTYELRAMKYTALLSFVLFAFAGACAPPSAPEAPPARPAALLDDEFGDYWYQGDAELTSYALEQAREHGARAGDVGQGDERAREALLGRHLLRRCFQRFVVESRVLC